jgi:hypothetical protein
MLPAVQRARVCVCVVCVCVACYWLSWPLYYPYRDFESLWLDASSRARFVQSQRGMFEFELIHGLVESPFSLPFLNRHAKMSEP